MWAAKNRGRYVSIRSAHLRHAGYQEPHAALAAASSGNWIFEIVKRNELHSLAELTKRWIPSRGSTDAEGRPRIGRSSIERCSLSCVINPSHAAKTLQSDVMFPNRHQSKLEATS